MKLCIPVNAPSGLESLLEPHLPSAEHLLFFDTQTRLCEEIALRGQHPGAAAGMEIHAVLCGSINRITLRTLIEQGIAVYGTDAQTAGQAIAQYENGELEAAVVAASRPRGDEQDYRGTCCSNGHGHGDVGNGSSERHCCGEGGGCGGQGNGHGHDVHGHESGACCGSHASPG